MDGCICSEGIRFLERLRTSVAPNMRSSARAAAPGKQHLGRIDVPLFESAHYSRGTNRLGSLAKAAAHVSEQKL